VATARGGREGHIRSSDGVLDAPLALPKEMGGPAAPRPTPSSCCGRLRGCFEGAVRLVAKNAKGRARPDTHVTAHVGIGPRQAGGFGLAVTLEVHLDGVERKQAEQLANTARQRSALLARDARAHVDVQIRVV